MVEKKYARSTPGGGVEPDVRTLAVPITESPPSIDIHGVKPDLDKNHWCIPYHFTQSFLGIRTLNLVDSEFLYTGTYCVLGEGQ